MFRYHLLKASKRFLAPGKETVSVGRLPSLASYRTVSLSKTLSVNAVIWQVEGLSSRSVSLGFTNLHLLPGACDQELYCSSAAFISGFSSSSTMGSFSADGFAWGRITSRWKELSSFSWGLKSWLLLCVQEVKLPGFTFINESLEIVIRGQGLTQLDMVDVYYVKGHSLLLRAYSAGL